jgi:hypothetical protein
MSELAHSRPLTEEELARCRRVAREVAALEDSASERWISGDGKTRIHGGVSKVDPRSVDDAFFNRLRPESFIFSGDQVGGRAPLPSWTDALAEVFDPGGDAPDWCIPAFRAYAKGLAGRDIFQPPLIMGETGWRAGGYLVNRDVVAYQERINLMREFGLLERLEAKRAPLVVEIGGGYGALAWYLKTRFPAATYVMIDLSRSLLFSGCYLAAALPGTAAEVFSSGRSITRGGVNLVSDADLGKLPAMQVDVAINTLSFAEMPEETVLDYCAWIERNLAPDGVLFEQNFDNRNLGYVHFSCPEQVIGRLLARRESRSRDLHWGKANLWTRKTGVRRLIDRLIA